MTDDPRPLTLSSQLDGLLFFPVTAFGPGGEVDLDTYRAHLSTGLAHGPAAVFACCGTGEFFSLDEQEYAACVQVAVEESGGRVPVFAGVGYGTALAVRFASVAADAGADGLLALPPYLVSGDQAGLLAHYRTLADRSPLDLIVYQRGTTVFAPDTVAELAAHPRIVGFKDGRGDLDLMHRIVGAVRERHGDGALVYLNGLPTAEVSAHAYRAVGVTGYSSAVFCFAPRIAAAFHRAYRADDRPRADALLDSFFRPYADLRDRGTGYAVSLVKAGVRLGGLDVGPVRPPLSEPAPAHLDELRALLARGHRLATSTTSPGEAA